MKTYKIIIIIIIIKGLSSALVEVGSGTGWTVYSPHSSGQTPDSCKAPTPHRLGKTPASPAGVVPGIFCTQEDLNLRPDRDATKTKNLTT
jgi:hypothetical protein